MKSIYEFTNYRHFLKDYYEERKKSRTAYSYQLMALQLQIASRSHLKNIIDGKKNIGLKTLQKVTKGFRFKKDESQYFEQMVMFTQTEDPIEKNRHFERLNQFPGRCKIVTLGKAHHKYLSKWYYPVIREMFTLQDMPSNKQGIFNFILRKLKFSLTQSEIETAITDLISLGLLVEKNSGLEVKDKLLDYTETNINFALQNIHRELIGQSLKCFAEPLDQREFQSLILGMNKQNYLAAKKKIEQFIEDFHFEFNGDNKVDNVYQLTLQFISLTKDEQNHSSQLKRNNFYNERSLK